MCVFATADHHNIRQRERQESRQALTGGRTHYPAIRERIGITLTWAKLPVWQLILGHHADPGIDYAQRQLARIVMSHGLGLPNASSAQRNHVPRPGVGGLARR